MSDLSIIAGAMRVTDYGDYYIIDFFDKKYVVRKHSIERDIMNMLKDIPCHYHRAFLRLLSLRLRINVIEIAKSIAC
jgi:hypothetical protein